MITHKDAAALAAKHTTLQALALRENLSIEQAKRALPAPLTRKTTPWTDEDKHRLTQGLLQAQERRGAQKDILAYYGLKNMGHALSILGLSSTTELYHSAELCGILKRLGLKLLRNRLYKKGNRKQGVELPLDAVGALSTTPLAWCKDNIELIRGILK